MKPVDAIAKINAESVRAQAERILRSPHFARSQSLSRFLQFVLDLALDGKTDEIKEYRLGVDVFGRGASFDPRIDPIVRMQAAKVRARLTEYYASEGRTDDCIITLPKGAYVPAFERRPEEAIPARTPHVDDDTQSIAVLPFVSMSGDPENEYFSDGLTEELINVLTYVPGLRVVARTSVFCFKNYAKDVREIGAQLNVKTVLEGSVRRSGDQLRVTAQLIDVATGYHLFSRTFPRELKDVFSLQEELAGAVVAEIMPSMRPESKPVVHSFTDDLEAYNLYLKGMFAMQNRYQGPGESIVILREVIHKNPNYAPAWAGLSTAFCALCWFCMLPAREAMFEAEKAARKAIELDNAAGTAYATLAMVEAMLHWNWSAAEQNFHKAISVQPGCAIAHQLYAYIYLLPQGRFDEAIASTERALQLNPFDPVLGASSVITYGSLGKHAAALGHNALMKETNPQHAVSHGSIAPLLGQLGRWDEAIASYRKATELSHRSHYAIASLAHGLARSGKVEEPRQILDEILSAPAPHAFAVSLVHLGLGNTSEAIQWFSRALENREPHTFLATFELRFAPLREVCEFRQLLANMGLSRFNTQ